MDQNRVVGAARNFGGKVEEGFGKVTGNADTQVEGTVNQAMGAAQELYGQAKDAASDAASAVKKGAVGAGDVVKEFITERPVTTAVLALFAGMVIAHIASHRRDLY